MVAYRREIQKGDFLLSKKDDDIVREVLGLEDGCWGYVEFWADDDEPHTGYCSANQLERWGTFISEAQALSIIGNIAIQRENLRQSILADTSKKLTRVPDELLVAELIHRGYRVIRKI